MTESLHHVVLDQMKTKLTELSWVSVIEFERIRLFSADIEEHELPMIQIYDVGETHQHVQGRTQVQWSLACELIMKSNQFETVDQGLLLDRRLEVKRKLGEDPTLGIQAIQTPSQGRFIHLKYMGGITDLHMLEAHHMARLDLMALFEEPYVNEC